MKTLLIGINSKYIHPAMGIHQIIANSNSDIIYKEFTIKDNIDTLLRYINNTDFDLLGFSVYIWNISKVKLLLSSLDNNLNIILGGPESSYRPDELFGYENVKYIIKNEGEESFNQLIEYIEGTRKIEEVSNLYYKENVLKYTFDKLPSIKEVKHDYNLIEDFKNKVVYLEASRGCCFQCSYCLASLEKSIRYFDISKVKKDILYILNKEAKVVKFLDRSFNINQNHMREILSFIRDNDNHITTFQFEIVADLLDDETIDLIKTLRKGLIRFEIGIQSTNYYVTKAVRRVQDFQLLKKNIERIKNNIVIHTDLIAGLPYEDQNSFIRTFNQTFTLFCEELQLGFLKELQGTHISQTKDIHQYKFDPNPPYEIIENKYISKEELEEIRLVEQGLNKYYNSGNFKRTCRYLFQELNLDPYNTFLTVIKFINKNHELHTLQQDDVAKLFYYSLKEVAGERLLYIIKQDYLLKDNIKPKIWWDNDISKQERNFIYKEFVKKYNSLKLDDLYRYSKLEKFNNEYFLVTYKPINIYYLNKNT